jgi:stage II sporulation protein D
VETSAANQAVKATEGEVLTYKNTLAFTPFHSDSGGHTATNAHVWGKDVPYLKGVKEPVAYQSPNASWAAKIPASQVQAALSKIGSSVGQVKEIRVAEADSGGRAINLTFRGSRGSSSVKSSLFRTTIGPNLLKSTMLTTGVPMAGAFEDKKPETKTATKTETKTGAKEPAWPSDVSGGNGASFQTAVSNALMSGSEEISEEMRLMRMTSDGVFTSAELMDMLINPDKRQDYLNVGTQRGSEGKKTESSQAPSKAPSKTSSKASSKTSSKASSKAPLPQSLSGASMPALRPTEPIREENGFFVFRGRGWGHGVGLSQWGAQALAKKGWSAERILEHYYPGTAVKRFK